MASNAAKPGLLWRGLPKQWDLDVNRNFFWPTACAKARGAAGDRRRFLARAGPAGMLPGESGGRAQRLAVDQVEHPGFGPDRVGGGLDQPGKVRGEVFAL